MRVSVPPRRARGGCGTALEQFARDGQARAVATDALGGLEVVVAVRAAGVTGDLGGLVERPAQRGWSLAREMPGRAALIGLFDGDVQAGVADRVARVREA